MAKLLIILGMLGVFHASTVFAQEVPASDMQKVEEKPLIKIIEKKDVQYGNHNAHKMDVFIPENAKSAPVILMVHGGAWKVGDKAGKNVVGEKLNKWGQEGFVFISMNYRLLPTAPYEQAQDIRRAVTYIQKHAQEWNADPEKIILMGHSAGAHLVGLATVKPSHAYTLGAKPWLGSVLLDSAAMNVEEVMMAPHARLYDKAFGTTLYVWRKASPYHQLTKDAFPMLLVCSTKREISCDQANAFADHARSMGVSAEVLEQDLSHRHVNKYLGMPNEYTASVDAFIQKLLTN